MTPVWLGQDACGNPILRLHVQPGARKTEIAGLHGNALKIRLAAAPVEGKANTALICFLAASLGVSRRQVELIKGAASREKCVRISGASGQAIAERLGGTD